MSEAKDKITAAMAELGLTVEAEFVPFSRSRNAGEKSRSLNWRVTLKRDGRDVLTTDYSAGAAHCPAYKAPVRYAGNANSVLRAEAIERETETGRAVNFSHAGLSMIQNGRPILPDPIDVVNSLVLDSSVLDSRGFEDWAADLGYDTDSRKAESIYRACLEIALQLRAAIGDAGIEALRKAGEDY